MKLAGKRSRRGALNIAFKDEWLFALFSIPLILSFCGEWGRTIVAEGFAALETMPDWYQYTLGVIVAASSGVIRRTGLWLLIAASVRCGICCVLESRHLTRGLVSKKARQCKHRVITFIDGCLDCYRLRVSPAFAHGCRLPDVLTPAPNTKTRAVLMKWLACPL